MATLTSRRENVASREQSPHVARAHQIQPTADAGAVDGGDDRHRAGGHGVRGALEAADQRQELCPLARAAAGEEGAVLLEGGGEIEAVGEGLGLGADDDGAHLGVGGEGAEGGSHSVKKAGGMVGRRRVTVAT